MNRRRLLRVFPKIWLDRYGEEFDALLDDLRSERRLDLLACADVVWLGIGASIDVSRLGVMSRLSRRGAKRRLFSLAGALMLAGGGVALGLALTAGAAQVSFVVPPPRMTIGSNGAIILAPTAAPTQELAAHEAACLLHSNYPPSGERLLAQSEPEGSARSLYRTSVTNRGRVGALGWELLDQSGSLTESLAPSVGLTTGGLAVAGRWYSLCDSFGDSGVGAPETGLAIVPGGKYDGRHVPGFIYGLVQPSSAKLVLTPSSGPSVIPRHIATVAGLDLFLAPLPSDPCTFTSLKVLQISAETANSETMKVQPGCDAFSPRQTRIVGSSSGSRTVGTVVSFGSNTLVLRTGFWPLLDVGITSTTPVFVEEGLGSWIQWNVGQVTEGAGAVTPAIGSGSTVYVAGRVTGNHETPTGIYLLTNDSGRP